MKITICALFLVVPLLIAQPKTGETSSTPGESRMDLLQNVELRFKHPRSFDVKGTASAAIPGSSWRATYEFETEGVELVFLRYERGPVMKELSTEGKLTKTQINAGATDPEPQRSFGLPPMGQYAYITQGLISAQKIGTESITFQGHEHSCEIIDAVYPYSFKLPNLFKFPRDSQIMHKRFSIDPSKMLVLRETRSSPDGMEWTGDVTSISFDLPPSEKTIKTLYKIANAPRY